MNDLTLIRQDGGAYIDSREVAEVIGKEHRHLLRDIRKYCEIMEKSTAPKVGLSDFFLSGSYTDSTGRVLPCYLISKMGCEMVAHKLTGEKGVLFTAAYVTAYNRMEAVERAALEARFKNPLPRLGEYNACARIIVPALRNLGVTSERIIWFLKGIYEPLGITVAGDEDIAAAPQTYTALQIARELGVYSQTGKPHARAVACVINEILLLGEKHKTITTADYGNHIGVSVRYDQYAMGAVKDWLVQNAYPSEVYGFERTFYVLYNRKTQ